MMKVSVVILNWNGREMLQRFLPSVLKYSNMEGVEICVADNASDDDSCAVLEKEFPEVKLIRLDQNYGFAEGYNRALQQVNATYALLLNSDVEVTEGWLAVLTDYMDRHLQVAACQPKILSQCDKSYFEYAGASGGFIDRYGYPFCRGRIFDCLEVDKGQYDEPIPVFWASGAALMIRLDIYRREGGLDGRFFAHMEEIDLCWRIRSRGYEIHCVPGSKVYHVGGGTLKKDSPHKTFLNFRNNLLMLYKNLPERELAKVMRVRWVLDYLAAGVFLLKGDWKNMCAVIRARKEYFRMKPQFTTDREDNLHYTMVGRIPERWNCSILWQAKWKRKCYFSMFEK